MPSPSRGPGRPPADPSATRFFDTAFHEFLSERLRHLPGMVRGGRVSVQLLSERLGYSDQMVYRYLRDEKLSPRAAKALAALSFNPRLERGTITIEDLLPYIVAE